MCTFTLQLFISHLERVSQSSLVSLCSIYMCSSNLETESWLWCTNAFLKWGHPSNHDTLTGPKGGWIRGSQLYYALNKGNIFCACIDEGEVYKGNGSVSKPLNLQRVPSIQNASAVFTDFKANNFSYLQNVYGYVVTSVVIGIKLLCVISFLQESILACSQPEYSDLWPLLSFRGVLPSWQCQWLEDWSMFISMSWCVLWWSPSNLDHGGVTHCSLASLKCPMWCYTPEMRPSLLIRTPKIYVIISYSGCWPIL